MSSLGSSGHDGNEDEFLSFINEIDFTDNVDLSASESSDFLGYCGIKTEPEWPGDRCGHGYGLGLVQSRDALLGDDGLSDAFALVPDMDCCLDSSTQPPVRRAATTPLQDTSGGMEGGKGVEGRRKRPRSDDEDARIIAAETELHLKKLNIDPDSKEGKVERRKIQNRMSAQMHRERKRAYIEMLEDEVRVRDKTIAAMSERIAELEGKLRAATSCPDLPQARSSSYRGSMGDTDSGDESSSLCSRSEPSQRSLASPVSLGLSLFSFAFIFSFSLFGPSIFVGSSQALAAGEAAHGRMLMELSPLLAVGGADSNSNELLDGSSAGMNGMTWRVAENLEPEQVTLSPAVAAEPAVRLRVVPASDVSSNVSLWQCGRRLAALYPPALQHSDAQTTARTEPMPVSVAASQHSLRGSPSTGGDRALVPTRPVLSPEETFVQSTKNIFSSFDSLGNSYLHSDWQLSSKAVMSAGKVLLDPALVQSKYEPGDTARGPAKSVVYGNSDSSSADRALIVPSVLNSKVKTFSRGANGPEFPRHDSQQLVRSSSPLLTMMLPASSIRWGKTWEDVDIDDPLRNILSSLASGNTGENDNETILNNNEYWIEIGCTIVTANLVTNVTVL